MKKQATVLIAGILLIVLAVIVLASSYYQGIEKTEIINVDGGSSAHYNFSIEDGKYIVLLTSNSNFSYKVYDEKGRVVDEGKNTSSAEISLENGDNYEIYIENNGNSEISVAITIAKEEVLNTITLLTYVSGALCSVGMVVIVVGISLILWYRKKEEKIYSRY